MDKISWKLIDTYFNENPENLVKHHVDSYNNFFEKGIKNIFRENNPIRFIERDELDNKKSKTETKINEILLYLGGKNGDKIYYGKPIIYDDNSNNVHYMYPNDARLRNMFYGSTIHYDVEVEIIYYQDDVKIEKSFTLEKMYLGKFPIMLQSNLCILKGLNPEIRFNMGECRNDFGGYFIIAGKEKVIIPQEKFADNMIYVRKHKGDDIYSCSADIRSVSEDTSKPIRTTSIKLVAESTSVSDNTETVTLTNKQIVVCIPNVRKPIPLFIVMRALGILSDKDIIRTCLLDIDANESYLNYFVPSIHDANKVFNQEAAILFIASFTKRNTFTSVIEILSNYFLAHIGELNFLDKAYFLGHMVYKLLKVYSNEDRPTDRDNFKFKRIELTGNLMYDLFREYYLIQKRAISLKIDKEFYYHRGKYKDVDFENLIKLNYVEYFKERDVETGFNKAFKGNWGADSRTKRMGVIQDLNRLSWNTFMSHLRKINLPFDPTSKITGPRLLNSSQWGFIDPVDSPDGANIGLHKHISLCTSITSSNSCYPIIKWLRGVANMKLLMECSPEYMSKLIKIFVNGIWTGLIQDPIELVKKFKLCRRNGLIPLFTSINFNISEKEIQIYTDAGRLTRPIYYIDELSNKPSFNRKHIIELFESGKISWEEIISGLNEKTNYTNGEIYNVDEIYPNLKDLTLLEKNKAIIDYIDTNEEEGTLIAMTDKDLENNKYYTHVEIEPSLMFGVMGNQVIYPENNPIARNVYACGQNKQAVSLYHSNYQMRFDKMGVVLNAGQTPIIKSKYMNYINKEMQPNGVNAIVAVMSYTGYNVEDAILINEGAVNRGIFRTTYYSMYETFEESSKIGTSKVDSKISNIVNHNVVGIKPGYDYSLLDDNGMLKENTQLNDKIVLIGKVTLNPENKSVYIDSSIVSKKGQLGVVDKAFITEGETGTKLAKIRIREERIPAIGDKMASRAGQKGTLGLIIPEEDMPFTADGLRPDLIINPHAMPSRMTIGHIVESIFGKACCFYGGFGDCTAYSIKGSQTKLYGEMLTRIGFHSSGNQLLHNGMTGDQIQSDIYIGPTYYMRLKHMVKDKINYRARGPRTNLTRQTVQGRANDGGLRIGEMERDGILAHGASYFLNESFMIRGDEYYMAICNKTGLIAVYNYSKNIFLSPGVDGPIKYHTNPDGTKNLDLITRFGRSFSIIRVPYSLKLLIQELQVMNIQMRIITDDNIDQLMSMSYSDNYKLLLQTDENNMNTVVKDYNSKLTKKLNEAKMQGQKGVKTDLAYEELELLSPEEESPAYVEESPEYAPYSPAPSELSPSDAALFGEETPEIYSPKLNVEEIGANENKEMAGGGIGGYEDDQVEEYNFNDDEMNKLFNKMTPKQQNYILSIENKEKQNEEIKKTSQGFMDYESTHMNENKEIPKQSNILIDESLRSDNLKNGNEEEKEGEKEGEKEKAEEAGEVRKIVIT
jgi:DNA-directed RNA polymerase II subunit RPB2